MQLKSNSISSGCGQCWFFAYHSYHLDGFELERLRNKTLDKSSILHKYYWNDHLLDKQILFDFVSIDYKKNCELM